MGAEIGWSMEYDHVGVVPMVQVMVSETTCRARFKSQPAMQRDVHACGETNNILCRGALERPDVLVT